MSNNPFMDYQEQFFKLWNDNMDQMLRMMDHPDNWINVFVDEGQECLK